MPTVFEESRSNLMVLPIFVCAICVLAVASVLARGIPADTSTRVAVIVAGAGAVISVMWILAWKRIRLATLAIDHDRIVMTPRGRRPEPETIVRRPDSRLHVEIATTGTASPTSRAFYVLYDAAAGKPRIAIDIFGLDRVKKAAMAHGWALAGH
jgi:hypothetical protein